MGRIGAALCVICLAVSVQASELVDLVREGRTPDGVKRLTMLLEESGDPAVQTVLVRTAIVWNLPQLLPQIRQIASTTGHAELARESARAIVLLAGVDAIAEALALSDRFERRLDPDIALAASRHGGIDAILAWRDHFSDRPARSVIRDYLLLSLWERPAMVPITSGRILGSRDARAWQAMLSVIEDSGLSLSRPILNVALTAEPALSDPAFWYLARIYATHPIDDPQEVRTFLANLDAAQRSVEGAYAAELIERAAGVAPRERKDWASWLASSDPKPPEFIRDFGRLLTPQERRSLGEPDFVYEQQRGTKDGPRPQFHFLNDLPEAWLTIVTEATGCESYWIGQPRLTLDPLGRVSEIDVSGVHGGPGCVEAVELLGRLSLVANRAIQAPRSDARPLVVRGPASPPCVIEPPVPLRPDMPRLAVDTTRSAVDLPRVVRRVPAGFPAELRGRISPPWEDAVSVRAEVGPDGCVRVYGLDAQSEHSEINTAALLAVSMWEMEPGTLRGEPIPVDFNLTVSFSWRGEALVSRD